MCSLLDTLSEKLDETLAALDESDKVWPELGEAFFLIDTYDEDIYQETFDNSIYHIKLRDAKLCFRTHAEAEAAYAKIVESTNDPVAYVESLLI